MTTAEQWEPLVRAADLLVRGGYQTTEELQRAIRRDCLMIDSDDAGDFYVFADRSSLRET